MWSRSCPYFMKPSLCLLSLNELLKYLYSTEARSRVLVENLFHAQMIRWRCNCSQEMAILLKRKRVTSGECFSVNSTKNCKEYKRPNSVFMCLLGNLSPLFLLFLILQTGHKGAHNL